MNSSEYAVKVIESFYDIDSSDWNSLKGADNPFLRHEFYLSLEHNKNLNHDSGWDCRIVCLFSISDDSLIAAMPMFAKSHSWAEFVFDWAWANAYHEHGYNYYPKLVVTTPYSPVTTHKCLTHKDFDHVELSKALISAAHNYAEENDFSSLHALFLKDDEKTLWAEQDYLERVDCQFHWQNNWHDDEDVAFDDFLMTLKGTKRKKIRQERKSLAKADIHFTTRLANTIDPDEWNDLYLLYSSTFLMRGQAPYFNEGMFKSLAESMGERMPVIQAWHGDKLMAAAICFVSDDTLYGRYWGAQEDIKNLHFETCYYQTIEYALKHNLKVIEPGTGGTHKLRRGFAPSKTHSMHWLKHEGFQDAISNFLTQETKHIDSYIEQAKQHLPFKP